MKTSKFNMMLLGMVMCSAANGYARTNGMSRSEARNQPRTEMRQGTAGNKRQTAVGYAAPMQQADAGRSFEAAPRRQHPQTLPARQPESRPVPQSTPGPAVHCNADMAAGVVVGTVIGTVIGALVH